MAHFADPISARRRNGQGNRKARPRAAAIQQSRELLYRLSVEGKQPAWVAAWLDQGKPAELIELQRSAAFKNEWPRVIRPDLLITETGLRITELDSVPGGIGLTAWLNQTYSQMGVQVIGGADGMLHGFAGIFGDAPSVHIVISEESATYRPEMAWLAANSTAIVSKSAMKASSPLRTATRFTVFLNCLMRQM